MTSVSFVTGRATVEHHGHLPIRDRHIPFNVILYVERGSYLLTRGGRTVRVRPGEAFCVPPLIGHTVEIDEVSVIRWAHISFTGEDGRDRLSGFRTPPVFTGETAARIGELLPHVVRSAGAEDTVTTVAFERYALELLYTILRDPAVLPVEPTSVGSFAADAYAYLRDHEEGEFSVRGMAEAFFLSVATLRRWFRDAFACSPQQYYVRMKMTRAAEWLVRERDTGVAVIARRAGFADPSYFTRAFRRYFGKSPARYRKEYFADKGE